MIHAITFNKLALVALAAGLFVFGQAKAQTQPGAVPKPPKMVPEMTEFWEPEVKTITPGTGTAAPSDAIILFDGKDLSQWKGKDGGAAKWQVKDGAMIVTKGTGAITTKQNFEDFQLHVEWSAPTEVVGNSQGRGNSGIFLQDRYEVQVLDNYNNRTYANGQAGSIYKQTPPLVNAMRKPGEWNTYDILYTAPRFKENGTLIMPARVTIIHNGVVVQHNTEIKGATEYIGLPSYKAHGKAPIQLQDHGNPVRFRNIWLREL
ncbi:3-keto-disaccharide hydrolase [Adhaeribacter rhizoryzae]|uniref:DUF1080 domain-containing protein n=1 Tax=Adhaeribacter rhizoryzae TaxID=2607907 RepID=A0A5M6DMK5_9BACT|nr:DUF1080 domain-containing protein [Adhaeribacter rhizoryzae]KAA5546625.1 DUF1080 domain-containing protein [Adhaeribacter rhizoryzae]